MYTDGLTISEIRKIVNPTKEKWSIRAIDLDNWLYKGDILKLLCGYIVNKYPKWILELISEEILKKSLTESEYNILHFYWNEGKTITQISQKSGFTVESINKIIETSKEKIKEAVFETWKSGIHDYRMISDNVKENIY